MIKRTPISTFTRIILFSLTTHSLALVVYLILRLLFGGRFWWLALANTFAVYLFLPLVLTMPFAIVVMFNIGSIRARYLLSLQIILALIAVVWFVIPMLPKSAPPANGTTLKVVTFNVWGWGLNRELETTATDWLLAQQADVIVLQEITDEQEEPRLRRLKESYPHEAIIDEGIRIFSRHPFIEEDRLVIEPYLPGRQVIRVVLNAEGKHIAVYGVHISLPRTEKPHLPLPTSRLLFNFINHYDETRRNAQIARLIDILEDEPYPFVVAGDFNMSEYSVVYHDLAAIMTDSFREAGVGAGTSWPVSRALGYPRFLPPLIRIDYIWHSPDLQAISAQIGDAIGSDHLPLVTTIVLPD